MSESTAPRRPALRYHGGKWKLAPWVMDFFPPHTVYVEPYGGAASVLLQKNRSHGEVYNDLESEVVNVFRVLRDPEQAQQLQRMVELTPFAREEFEGAYGIQETDVDRAHAMICRAFMGFGSASVTRTHKTGFRSNATRSGTTPATDWRNWPEQIEHFTRRLQGVVIENRPALDVILQHDSPQTLHYVDPPYPWSTRTSMRGRTHCYRHEMADADHEALAGLLHHVEGMVVISGYPCDLYDQHLYVGWARYERKHFADGARERTEVLWLNDNAARARINMQEAML